MLLDGFAQRFSFCVAEQDDRPIVGDYDFDHLADQVAPHWQKIISTPPHPVYKVSQEARGVFNHVVAEIVTKARQDDIDDSFSRRLAFNTYKYGLAYHILSGKTDDVIGPEDLAQGAQLVALHLLHLRKILDLYEVSPRERSTSPVSSTANRNETGRLPVDASPEPHVQNADVGTLSKVKSLLEKRKADNVAPITLSKLQSSIRALRSSSSNTRAMALQAVSEDPSLAPFVVF
jgi:hypothetical protein